MVICFFGDAMLIHMKDTEVCLSLLDISLTVCTHRLDF